MAIQALDDQDFQLSTGDFELIASIAREQAGIVIRSHKAAMIRGRLLRRLRALNLRTVREYCELLRGPGAETELPQLLNVLTTNHTRSSASGIISITCAKTPYPRCSRGPAVATPRCASGAPRPRQARNPIRSRAWSMQDSRPAISTCVSSRRISTPMSWPGRRLRNIPAKSSTGPRPICAGCCSSSSRGAIRSGSARNLRKLLTFRQLNLVQPWPMTGIFDAMLCRNVMIYFDPPTKKSIVDRAVDLLRPGGWLYLGHSESLSPPHPAFELIGRTVYRRR